MVDALLAAGALSVDVSDAAAGTEAEQPIFGEPGIGDELVWTAAMDHVFNIEAGPETVDALIVATGDFLEARLRRR